MEVKEKLKAIFIKKLTEVYDYEIEHLQPEKERYILETANALLHEITLDYQEGRRFIMSNKNEDVKETTCHICKKKKYCIEDFYYDEENGWNKVFVCLKCYKENT